jgi:hypothetical protein
VENAARSLAQERLPADPAGNEGDDRRDSRGRPHPAEVAEPWEREAAAAPDGADGIQPFSRATPTELHVDRSLAMRPTLTAPR